jgi:hypothetical protein
VASSGLSSGANAQEAFEPGGLAAASRQAAHDVINQFGVILTYCTLMESAIEETLPDVVDDVADIRAAARAGIEVAEQLGRDARSSG